MSGSVGDRSCKGLIYPTKIGKLRFEEVVRLDTEYINNWSLGLDIRILFRTIGAVLRHKGAM